MLSAGSATTQPLRPAGSSSRRNLWIVNVPQYSLPWTQPWIQTTGPSARPRTIVTGMSIGEPSGSQPTCSIPSTRPECSDLAVPISISFIAVLPKHFPAKCAAVRRRKCDQHTTFLEPHDPAQADETFHSQPQNRSEERRVGK